jgi:4-hydroxybenzoate adenylyltransferase
LLDPFAAEIRDDDGIVLPPGSVGHLWLTGPTLFLEYLGRPDATDANVGDGWLGSGDLARIDDEGFLFHEGRADDVQMVGGINVWPFEIEDVLCQHPQVFEAAVVSAFDGTGASRLHAFVVPAAGASPDTLGDELSGYTAGRLSAFKVPRVYHLVEALPRTTTGKLQRFRLREMAGDQTIRARPASPA